MIKTQLNVDGTLQLHSVFHGLNYAATFTTDTYIAMDMLNLGSKHYCTMLRGSNGDLTSTVAVDIWEPGQYEYKILEIVTGSIGTYYRIGGLKPLTISCHTYCKILLEQNQQFMLVKASFTSFTDPVNYDIEYITKDNFPVTF